MTQPQPPVAPPLMDALAAWRCWAVEVELDIDGEPRLFRIEPAPAAEWLIATVQSGHLAYLPGMLDDVQRDELMQALDDHTLTTDDLVTANRDAIEVASGWRWWQAGRLIGTLSHGWARLGGMLMATGIDPTRHSLGAVLGGVYSMLYQNTPKKEDREKLIRTLVAPPEIDMQGEEWDEDKAHEALWAMMAAQSRSAT